MNKKTECCLLEYSDENHSPHQNAYCRNCGNIDRDECSRIDNQDKRITELETALLKADEAFAQQIKQDLDMGWDNNIAAETRAAIKDTVASIIKNKELKGGEDEEKT